MNIPQISSIDNTLKVYYEYPEIGNKEIRYLFGNRSSATISRLKKMAKEEMIIRDMPTFCTNKVNTAIAFDAWGINISDIEKRMKKMRELDLWYNGDVRVKP